MNLLGVHLTHPCLTSFTLSSRDSRILSCFHFLLRWFITLWITLLEPDIRTRSKYMRYYGTHACVTVAWQQVTCCSNQSKLCFKMRKPVIYASYFNFYFSLFLLNDSINIFGNFHLLYPVHWNLRIYIEKLWFC